MPDGRHREFGFPIHSAPFLIKLSREFGDHFCKFVGIEFLISGCNSILLRFFSFQAMPETFGAFRQLILMLRKGIGDVCQQIFPLVIFEISTAIKRFLVGHQENVQRPTSLQPHVLNRIHVDIVNVRPLFPVDFDADKMIVHQICGDFIFETFPLHHMTPMASRIPDGNDDRFVFYFCFSQGFRSPGKPIHGIVRMLKEIGTLAMDEAICGHWKV